MHGVAAFRGPNLGMGPVYGKIAAALGRELAEGFMKTEHRDMILIDPGVESLLDGLAAGRAPRVDKWIGRPGS